MRQDHSPFSKGLFSVYFLPTRNQAPMPKKAKARSAIQEVEDALTRYAAAHERAENARVSANQYQQFFKTVEIRYSEGASNLLELEDARRSMLDAQQTLLNVMQERLQAWVALNRATGGAALYEPEAIATGSPRTAPAE